MWSYFWFRKGVTLSSISTILKNLGYYMQIFAMWPLGLGNKITIKKLDP